MSFLPLLILSKQQLKFELNELNLELNELNELNESNELNDLKNREATMMYQERMDNGPEWT